MPRPFRKDLGWTPYIYLVYLFFVFLQPFSDHAKAWEWAVTAIGFLLFLPCYVGVFERWRPGGVWWAGGLAVLGFASIPINLGTTCYVIYAGASLGFVLNPAVALRVFWLLMALLSLEFWLLKLPAWYAIFMLLMTAAVSLGNIHTGAEARANAKLKRANDELQHLARVAERERIARDLHDVLGHTLSVIVLKSELAGRLLERDPARAHLEITQVEEVARNALSEVRQAIGGYRAASLPEEFARAKETLETAGVATKCEFSKSRERLGVSQEAVLALIVREAITNVVRHAAASHCEISLSGAPNGWCLTVIDDGRGGALEEGNGLRGMRERVEALGGAMKCEGKSGTRLEIFIPQHTPREAIT